MLNHIEKMTDLMPKKIRRKIEPLLEALSILREIKNPNALSNLLPSFGRGFILQLGRRDKSTKMPAEHSALFDWDYSSDFPEMRELYTRAKQNQWDSEVDVDWSVDVDPMNPERPLLPDSFMDLSMAEDYGIKLSVKEYRRFKKDITAWMLSQFLHGEQGALYAAAQVTESIEWVDGKLYGATQVMDEGRHVESFHRYIDQKLEKLYVINDNLFTIIDALMTDSRWDMKFLGMQIMVEGLALGAFGMLYKVTGEPLLKEMLRYIILDEARHVHYGVLALGDHMKNRLSEKERKEREDWVFEVALLMQNRFMLWEVYEEWFGHKLTRKQWRELVTDMPGMREFRQVMFSRLIPNLRQIGLLSGRMLHHYEDAGLLKYASGASALEMNEDEFLAALEEGPSHVV
jgi:hypothetical protein